MADKKGTQTVYGRAGTLGLRTKSKMPTSAVSPGGTLVPNPSRDAKGDLPKGWKEAPKMAKGGKVKKRK